MNGYAKSATEDFKAACQRKDIWYLAASIKSKAFGQQARTYLASRWAGVSTEEAIADLREQRFKKQWEIFRVLIIERGLNLVPEQALKAIPLEAWHQYTLKTHGNIITGEDQTLLSLALSSRKLPETYKAYLKSLPNQPNLPHNPARDW